MGKVMEYSISQLCYRLEGVLCKQNCVDTTFLSKDGGPSLKHSINTPVHLLEPGYHLKKGTQ